MEQRLISKYKTLDAETINKGGKMTLDELKKKRGFSVASSFTDDLHITFKSSDKNRTREAYSLLKENGIKMSQEDICGGKAVGGYYASGFVSPNNNLGITI